MITLATAGLNRKPLNHCHRAPEGGQYRQVRRLCGTKAVLWVAEAA
jgi:hypothetical protein